MVKSGPPHHRIQPLGGAATPESKKRLWIGLLCSSIVGWGGFGVHSVTQSSGCHRTGQGQCEGGPEHTDPTVPDQPTLPFTGSFRPQCVCGSLDLSPVPTLWWSMPSQYALCFGFCFLICFPRNSHLQSLLFSRCSSGTFLLLGIHFPLSFLL